MSKPTILLADDHPLFRKGVRGAIEILNIAEQVLEAADGREVLEIESKQKVDLFILDYRMPRLDGLETAQILLRKNPRAKIITLTMYSEIPLIFNLMSMGVKGFLIKNSGIDDFEKAIHAVLNGDEYMDQSLRSRVLDFEQTEFIIQLTDRERELLKLLGEGLTSKRIGEHMGITGKSVEVYRSRLFNKLGVKNTSELVNYAHKNGML